METAMLNKIMLLMAAGALMALLTPSEAGAYGAAHVGYTHVGPSGVYHKGATATSGPGGASASSHTSAYGTGGGAYHSASGGASGSGGAAGGYHYSGASHGGAAYGSAHYSYVR
jgi:hypothetical protein